MIHKIKGEQVKDMEARYGGPNSRLVRISEGENKANRKTKHMRNVPNFRRASLTQRNNSTNYVTMIQNDEGNNLTHVHIVLLPSCHAYSLAT